MIRAPVTEGITLAQGIYAYVTLNEGVGYSDALKKELVMGVREQIGAFAAPDVIHWAPGAGQGLGFRESRRFSNPLGSRCGRGQGVEGF